MPGRYPCFGCRKLVVGSMACENPKCRELLRAYWRTYKRRLRAERARRRAKVSSHCSLCGSDAHIYPNCRLNADRLPDYESRRGAL